MTEVSLWVYECQNLLIGNTTLLSDAALAFLTTIIATPAGVESEGQFDTYLFDAWATAKEIAAFLAAHNIEAARMADSIFIESEGNLVAGVDSGNVSLAFTTPANAPRVPNEVPGATRFFYGSTVAWVEQEERFTETLPPLLEPGVMNHAGGTVARIQGQEQGESLWVASNNLISATVTFGSL